MEEKSGSGNEYKKGLWTVEEDRILLDYVGVHGKGKWNRIPKHTGLKRCGKSCRLRWINYLSPSVKRGDFSEEENDLIIRLHNLLGNRWSLIAGRVPGRTDNQVKNHWNTHLSKKLGINKEKNKGSASSQTIFKKPSRRRQSCSQSMDPNDSVLVSTFVEDEEVIRKEEGEDKLPQTTVDEGLISGNDHYHFQSPSNWLFHNHTPNNVMEFLDESLDFFWHGL